MKHKLLCVNIVYEYCPANNYRLIMEKIPVTIITGFLGSGKTTLLSKLLKSDKMQNAALIINEFGEIGIDNLLVKSSVENTLLLENGCVCCSIRGDLSDTISGLFSQAENEDIPYFDIILIETTGLAHPGPIVQTVQTDISINNRCRFDKVITVVDTIAIYQQLKLHQEPSKQIIQGDFIYLSKTDIATNEQIQDAHNLVINLNPTASVKDKLNAQQIRESIVSLHLNNHCLICDHHDHLHQHSHSIENIGHLTNYRNCYLRAEKPLDKISFMRWLSSLYSFYPLSILRLKGFVQFKEPNQSFLIQAVGPIFSEMKMLENSDLTDIKTSLVIILRDMDVSKIEESFARHVLTH